MILSIETSTSVCAIALHEQGKLVAETSLHQERSHSTHLADQVRFLLDSSERTFGDLAAVAISSGPGSYTGLRIGTSFSKGICYAREIPIIGIGSLASMALGVRDIIQREAFYIPMMDARRMEVYAQVFNRQMQEVIPARPVLLEEFDFEPWLDERPCYFFGNGSGKAKDVLRHPNAIFIDDVVPSAVPMGKLAWDRFSNEDFDDVAYFEPNYLKEFKATKPKKIF